MQALYVLLEWKRIRIVRTRELLCETKALFALQKICYLLRII